MNKTQKDKTSMDFRLIVLAFGIALGSCAEIKETADAAADSADNVLSGKRPFSLTFKRHTPYCGGAAPSVEQMNGFTVPMANDVFYIYEGERPSSTTKMTKVTTDSIGRFTIDLPPGTYSVIRGEKALPLDEFIALKKVEDSYYTYEDDVCFSTWRNTPDFTAELKSGHINEVVTISARCFTGDNPCMQYTGPYPP